MWTFPNCYIFRSTRSKFGFGFPSFFFTLIFSFQTGFIVDPILRREVETGVAMHKLEIGELNTTDS